MPCSNACSKLVSKTTKYYIQNVIFRLPGYCIYFNKKFYFTDIFILIINCKNLPAQYLKWKYIWTLELNKPDLRRCRAPSSRVVPYSARPRVACTVTLFLKTINYFLYKYLVIVPLVLSLNINVRSSTSNTAELVQSGAKLQAIFDVRYCIMDISIKAIYYLNEKYARNPILR